ncbi:sigma-54-dependent transcriptional regulator [Calditerrivibrio nitroreducens]|uniref:Two component, sigma54 specific, transcriptional regulator, Fis family n=1 Tax=Calditerrivibrio nitroreducens (strain DSM 19672 / NBRC 101217 / Yu37-1) TaxID=768670 RepID=E4TJ25_CALNY|nr:sigma-54 dependent transcriptional regulator [Calditerrivibrio nitroreducens]ADR19157.1 two component, sigma54 specific, transcriptional regulator, Fis family [Calditerrivibrio nitroreducens DSM 19672]
MKILIIEDNKILNNTLVRCLKENYEVYGTTDPEAGLNWLENNLVDVVISDIKLPKINGLDLLKKIKEISSDIYVILITGYGTVEEAVDAIKSGAHDYLIKPVDIEVLKLKLSRISETISIKERILLDNNKVNIIFKSSIMLQLFNFTKKVAQTDSNILLEGESGTGKDLFARFIHENSLRSKNPIVSINCANIQENIFESELFGYRKGAFTGADRNKRGLISVANGGTVFLDEVSEISLNIQAKLLRFIETKTFYPLGSETQEKSDIRLITATNKDLNQLIKNRDFRDDLYYRISVVKIKIPPLRERKDDILPLAYFFIDKFKSLNPSIKDIEEKAKEKLLSYTYPGNVRELSNIIERAMIIENGGNVITSSSIITEKIDNCEEDLSLAEVEKRHIMNLLKKNNYDKVKTASMLKIDRSTLYRKLKEYNLQ